jgi:HK97 family phage major capsid protein
MFIESDVFTGYPTRGTSARFEVDYDSLQTRALPTGIADLVAAGFKGSPYQVDTTPPRAPTPLMDNVAQIQVSGNSIEYIAWTKKAGGATKVAEKAAKPSAEWGPTVTPATLDTFAVYTQLTRQMIEDFAAVRTLIDGELRNDVAKAEEADAAALMVASAATIPDATSTVDLLSAIRVGIGTVQAAGYEPNAVLLNPADWAALDIVVMGATVNGPTIGQSFWGLRPIASSAVAAGNAIVGDYRSAIHHYYRSAISLYVTDSHADTFLSNVFTLLAERRSKTVIVRPAALSSARRSRNDDGPRRPDRRRSRRPAVPIVDPVIPDVAGVEGSCRRRP